MSKSSIKFSFDSSLLDKKLKKMSKKVKEVSKPRTISADVVLTDKWIASHTTKNSLAQFENDAPFDGDFSDPKLINECLCLLHIKISNNGRNAPFRYRRLDGKSIEILGFHSLI